jgi:hypothetical protein
MQKVIRDAWTVQNFSSLEIARQSYITKEKDARASLSILSTLFVKRMRERDRTFMKLAIYLFLAEGAYASYMNFLCFMLVSQGHDLYDVFKRRFACSFEEIEDVNLETKEQFLKEHNLGLFKKGLKRKLRNAIAHYDFQIEKNGSTRVRGQLIDINTEIQQLIHFMAFLHGAAQKGFEQIDKKVTRHSKTKRKGTQQ